jgi:hypothetical protein
MLPSNIHFAIDQGLQNLGSYVYSNMLPQEIDLQFNTTCDLAINKVIGNTTTTELQGYEDIQLTTDDLKNLKVVNSILTYNGEIAVLPSNYRNLVNDRSLVFLPNCPTQITSGNLLFESYYLVPTGTTITYNGTQYGPGSVFRTVPSIYIFTLNSGTNNYVYLLLEKQNRLYRSEELYKVKDSYFTRSKYYSTISYLENGNLRVIYDTTYTVSGIVIDYIRIINPLVYSNTSNWTEFPDYIIWKLIDLTVARILELTSSARFETKTIENKS